MSDNLNILLNESEYDYCCRICSYKIILNLTWEDIANILNSNLGYNYSKDTYRKRFGKVVDYINQNNLNIEIPEEIIKTKKEKCKLSDEKVQINALIRRLAREDTIKEIAHDLAITLPKAKLKQTQYNLDYINEGILCLSDWHYGNEINLPWNKYNTEIAKERLSILIAKVINFIKLYKLKHISVLNLGDLINGRIHLTLRLNSRIDVLTQIIEVSQLLADFINQLSEYVTIDYYDCSDNHSRLEPNKSDSLELESLSRITTWYLETIFKSSNNVKIHLNELDNDIISFDVFSYHIGAVHGHKDKPEKAIENLTLMTKTPFDLICTAHLHHFSGDEKNECILISNGSLMGTDKYASDLRHTSKPSQNLIIATPDDITYGLHIIKV